MASSAPIEAPLGGTPLLDLLLDEQQRLTAVERFARRHVGSEQAPVYEDLIPLSSPGEGEQLAFQVDLDRCTGCKACVTACHSLNGLDADETWRSVGRLLGTSEPGAVQQTVTGACHHCEDPACLAGCPVRAYDKHPVTGIVRHLDDQCIGCRYCQLTCPYDVPRFNERLGIVRKCDLCADRLSQGEAPACVQGCPNGAISIRIVARRDRGRAGTLLPNAPLAAADASHTRPATRYVTRLQGVSLDAADDRPRPAPAHDPLAVMLVLVQTALGLLLCDVALRLVGLASAPGSAVRLGVAAALAGLGLLASTLHLGRPLYAFRAFLGWRTSWMSREVLAFGGFLAVLSLAAGQVAAGVWLPAGQVAAGVWLPALPLRLDAAPLLGLATLLGVATAACSIMIYASTHRRFWALRRTAFRFVGSVVAAGVLSGALSLSIDASDAARPAWLAMRGLLATGAAAALCKLVVEIAFQRRPHDHPDLERSARLLAGPLARRFRLRMALTLAGAGLALLAAALGGVAALPLAVAALPLVLGGELVERHLFFTAEAARAMPGA